MRAGRLRHLLTVQSASHAQDDMNEDIETWSDAGTTYGDIQPGDGRKYVKGEQNVHEISHEITIRYYSGLTQAHRLKFGSRVFNIVRVLNIGERNIKTMVLCKEEI